MTIRREQSVLEIPLWFNNNITVSGKYIFYKEWYTKGVRTIADVLNGDDNGNFLSFEDIRHMYNITTNILKYRGLISSVKKYLLNHFPLETTVMRPIIPLHIKFFLNKNYKFDPINILLH